MGAVQAQGYLGGLWGVGLSVADATEADVEAAVARRHQAGARRPSSCRRGTSTWSGTRNAPRRATPWPSAETRPGSSAHRWSLIDGIVRGTWKRSLATSTARVTIEPWTRVTKDERRALEKAPAGYGRFVGREVEVRWAVPEFHR